MLSSLSGALLHSLWQLTALALLLFVALRVLRSARHRYAAALITLALQAVVPVLSFLERSSVPAGGALGEEQWWQRWVVAAWAAGAGLMSVRLAGGVWEVRRWVNRAARVPLEWQRELERWAASWGVSRVSFRADQHLDVPMTVGFLTPVVLLPLSLFTAVPASALELLVAHELAHVRRWDYLVNLLQRAVEALFFFHPAVWWVSERSRDERELCCDDLVAGRCGEPVSYARALLALEQHRHDTASLALASHGGAFMQRIERLVQEKQSGARGSWAALAVGGLALSAALFLVAAPAWAAGKSLSIAWLPPAMEPHRALIEEVARERGVEPDLLALFVLVESSGDPAAVSPSGARGLMQLMPRTAEQVAKELGVPWSVERLEDPRFNLELGAAYLSSQLAAFPAGPRQVELAAAAYNGGPRAARAWMEGKGRLSSETERYSALMAKLWDERLISSSKSYEGWRSASWGRRAAEAMAPVAIVKPSMAFGAQVDPFNGKPYQHAGVDLPAAVGAPVFAPLDGVVVGVSEDPERGTVLVLRHGGGLETRFHHLGEVKVAVDQRVTRGATVASVGVTGKTTGPHVHFEVRDLGVAIDPAKFLAR